MKDRNEYINVTALIEAILDMELDQTELARVMYALSSAPTFGANSITDLLTIINEQSLHCIGLHADVVRMDLIPEDAARAKQADAYHHLLRQTFDWRTGSPDKAEYTVTLTSDELTYIGAAMEVYSRLVFNLHSKTVLDEITKKISKIGVV